MKDKPELDSYEPDPAAVFACAISLWEATHKRAEGEKLNLSDLYNGVDQLMREVMRIGTLFEVWACRHLSFDALNDVWPYLLEDRFGDACLDIVMPNYLTVFDESDCLRVALRLRLPVKTREGLPVPVEVTAINPVPGSPFQMLRIQTMRNSVEDDDAVLFTPDDDPFDGDFESPYFALYGVGNDGHLEHIADRRTYSETKGLAEKLAPGVEFPVEPIAVCEQGAGRAGDANAAADGLAGDADLGARAGA